LGDGKPAQGASYVIFKDGSDYKARNGIDGTIDYNQTNLATVLQAAVDALTDGGTIYLGRNVNGADIASKITLDNNAVRVVGEHTYLDIKTNGSAFELTNKDCWLVGLYLDAANQVSGNTVSINTSASYRNKIYDCTIINNAATGLYLGGSTYGNRVCHCNIGANNLGIDIDTSQTNTIFNNFIESNTTYGVHIHGTMGENKIIFNFMESNNDGILCAYDKNLILGNEMNAEGRYGISLTGDYNRVIGNTFYNGTDYAIISTGDNNVFTDNIINQTNKMNISGTGNIVKNNPGYITENSGSSTGTGSEQTIAHGLAGDLVPNNVTVVPTVTGATVTAVWADATNIYCTVTSGKTFNWTASVV